MILNLITPPQFEPVTLADVEGQCRIGSLSDESVTIDLFIQAVREKAESFTRRQIMTATWEMTFDGFPSHRGQIEIPLPPLNTVDSITYTDMEGIEQTFTAYNVVKSASPKCQPAYIVPAYGGTWPVALNDVGSVKIRFTAGYGNAPGDVPAGIRQWILLNVANLYENRESETVSGVRLTAVDLSTMADGLIQDYVVRTW